jgi:formate dehydrogenase major subunit
MDKLTITIDGITIKAEPGMTVLQAALANGIYIPNLCNHPDLAPAGFCRVCVVRVDNWKIAISCKTQVKDGMVISTEDPEVVQTRKTAVELLLAYHPMTCLTCEKNTKCELQKVAHYVGITPEGMKRYRRGIKPIPKDDSNPFFTVDHSKCILCGICVRTCDELQNINAIDYVQRGVSCFISTLGQKPIAESQCESCGECVSRCPVGALSPKNTLEPMREVSTVCTYCGVGCGIHLGVRGDRIVSARGDKDSVVNKGSLCVKGRYGYDFVNSSERLTSPLIKKDGEFVESSWDEALDLVAAKFAESRGDGFAALASARMTNEDNYALQKFTRAVMETNSIDHCARL